MCNLNSLIAELEGLATPVEVENRIAFEARLLGFVAFQIWQPRNAIALWTSMQRKPRQMRDR